MCPFPKALKGPLCQVPWTFHRPVLGKSICQWVTILAFISELRYFGLSAFKCTPCFLGNWSWEREARLGAPRADGVGGLPKETGLFCRPGLRRKLCWLSPRPSCKNALARQQIINSPECPPSRLKTRIFFSCVGRTALHSYPGAPPQPHLQRAVISVLAPLLGPRITQPRWTMINSLPSSMKKGGIPLEVLSFIWAETCWPRRPEGQFCCGLLPWASSGSLCPCTRWGPGKVWWVTDLRAGRGRGELLWTWLFAEMLQNKKSRDAGLVHLYSSPSLEGNLSLCEGNRVSMQIS